MILITSGCQIIGIQSTLIECNHKSDQIHDEYSENGMFQELYRT